MQNPKVSTSPFPVQANIRFVLIKSKPKLCQNRPYVLFKTYLACQEINYAITVTIKWKINVVFFLGNLTFKLISTFKYFAYVTAKMTTNIGASIL